MNNEYAFNRRRLNNIKEIFEEKTGTELPKKCSSVPKRLAVCAAALVLTFTALSFIGFDKVAAAISELFTFIPGVGIQEKSENVYMLQPITSQIKSDNISASIVRAVYSENHLTVVVEVGKRTIYDDFRFYINGTLADYKGDDGKGSATYSLSTSSDSSMLWFSCETQPPKADDIYEMEIAGFTGRLSFKMTPCRDFDDISKIGPTDIKGGISITTTADIIDDKLVVWCYPFYTENITKDRIIGYGNAVNAAWVNEKYIETESGIQYESKSGWGMTGRLIFDKPESLENVKLHLPYLAMLREEKKRLNIKLPKDYVTVDSDIALECSLGTVRVTEIRRTSNEHETDMDTVWLKFAFDSKEENKRFNSFDFELAGRYSPSAMHFDADSGCLQYLEVYVGKDEDKIALNISQLYYYLMNEYTIPLDIK